MNIKNYTSSVPADRSILQIENILIEMGARNIAKDYDDAGRVQSISFSIKRGEGIIPFRLPAKKEPIKKLFIAGHGKRRPTVDQVKGYEAQAERTAWKNVKEWVELQATMIKLEQVEFLEVFMPYIFSFEHQKTLFERMKSDNFKQLTT